VSGRRATFSFAMREVVSEKMRRTYTVSAAVLAQRRAAPLKHGARSPAQIGASARAQKRRLLRQLGLRASDLDGVGLAFLDTWARSQSKVQLCDAYFEEYGFLDEQGKPRPAAHIYLASLNSARLAATRLAEHLRSRGVKSESLESYLESEYGAGNGG
jgi:hypothetical protein